MINVMHANNKTRDGALKTFEPLASQLRDFISPVCGPLERQIYKLKQLGHSFSLRNWWRELDQSQINSPYGDAKHSLTMELLGPIYTSAHFINDYHHSPPPALMFALIMGSGFLSHKQGQFKFKSAVPSDFTIESPGGSLGRSLLFFKSWSGRALA